MSLHKKLAVFSVLSVMVLSVFSLPIAFAQDANQAPTGGSGLQVSPTRSEISAQPGEKKTFSVTLKNVTQGAVKAQAFINDFESDNNSGTPKIIVDETKSNTPYSIKTMVSGVQDVELKAGETKQLEYTLEVPAAAAPGAYFGAVRFAAVPLEQASSSERQVSLTASVAHLVFVEIPGDVVQKIQLENVAVQLEDGKKVAFYQKPLKSAVTVKNLGNGFSRPFGKVTVQRGSSTVYSYDLNSVDPKGIVLPNSSRTFTDDIKGISTPGKYKMTAGVAYGNGGEVVTDEVSFWYLPLWFLGALALVVIALIGGGYFGYRKVSGSGGKASKKSS